MASKKWEQELQRRARLSPEDLEDLLRRRREYNTIFVRSQRQNMSPEKKKALQKKQLEYARLYRQSRKKI